MGYVIYAVGYLCLYRLYVGKLFKTYDNKIRGFYFFGKILAVNVNE